MKKMNRGKKWLAVGVLISLCLTACGSASEVACAENEAYGAEPQSIAADSDVMSDDLYVNGKDVTETTETTVEEGNSDNTNVNSAETERKLITTMNMSVETSEIGTLLQNIEDKTKEMGGYIESSSMQSDQDGRKNAYYTIRIPEAQRENFVTMIDGESNVLSKSSNVDDVTLSYVDLQSRVAVLEGEIARLQDMLNNAGSLDDMLTIESRLYDVIAEKESLESQLRMYDNLINYSTINIDISEVVEFTVVEEPVVEKTAWEKMSNGFMRNLNEVLDGCKAFGIGLFIRLPYLIPLLVIVLVFWIIIASIIKHCKKSAEKRRKQTPQQVMSNYVPNPYMVQPGMPQQPMMAPQQMATPVVSQQMATPVAPQKMDAPESQSNDNKENAKESEENTSTESKVE